MSLDDERLQPDRVGHVVMAGARAASQRKPFHRGDPDDDGRIDTTDPVLILRWLFLEGSAPAPPGPPTDCLRARPGQGLDAYGAC